MFLRASLALCCCFAGHADWGLHAVPILAATSIRPSHYAEVPKAAQLGFVAASNDVPAAFPSAANLRAHEFHHRILQTAEVYGGDLKLPLRPPPV